MEKNVAFVRDLNAHTTSLVIDHVEVARWSDSEDAPLGLDGLRHFFAARDSIAVAAA